MSIIDDFFSSPVSMTGIPGFSGGVARGIVKENWDSKHPGKVKAELFLGEDGANITGWIPVMTPYAGKNFGSYFLPEVGTEVIVGFTMGDRNCPVVLGCLWNTESPIPEDTADKDNKTKRLKTKGGCEVVITETENKQKIEIKTAQNTGILIDDENSKIRIGDGDKKNGIEIDIKGGVITLEAEKKIVLKAGGSEIGTFDGSGKSVKLESGKIELSAQSDLAAKGQNVKLDGTSVAVSANGSLSIKSNGMTEVKGSMVKIN